MPHRSCALSLSFPSFTSRHQNNNEEAQSLVFYIVCDLEHCCSLHDDNLLLFFWYVSISFCAVVCCSEQSGNLLLLQLFTFSAVLLRNTYEMVLDGDLVVEMQRCISSLSHLRNVDRNSWKLSKNFEIMTAIRDENTFCHVPQKSHLLNPSRVLKIQNNHILEHSRARSALAKTLGENHHRSLTMKHSTIFRHQHHTNVFPRGRKKVTKKRNQIRNV